MLSRANLWFLSSNQHFVTLTPRCISGFAGKVTKMSTRWINNCFMRQWPETSRGVDLEKDSKYYWTVNTSPNTECFQNAGSLLHGKIEIRVAVGSDSCKNGFDLSSRKTQVKTWSRFYESSQQRHANLPAEIWLARNFETVRFPITSSPRARPLNWVNAALYSYMIVADAVSLHFIKPTYYVSLNR